MKPTVLVLDSDSSTRDLCQEVAQSLCLGDDSKANGETLAAQFELGQADIVLAGSGGFGASGVELLKKIKKDYPETEVVVLSDDTRVSSAVEAIKLGAYEYLPKPIDPGRLKNVLEKLVRRLEQSSKDHLLQEKLRTQHGLGGLVGTSLKMRRIYRMILKLASRRHPVMIVGESGTGKELVARSIHAFGPFRQRPFVPVDCSALAPTLIESELFGHVRGAFTGAHMSRPGLLESARGGTILLDEVAELSVGLQAKLLRALQEREFKPLGSNNYRPLEARVIAASNRTLEEAVARDEFRKDIYFRLSVVNIRVPALRERKNDIPLLVQHFLDRLGGERGTTKTVSTNAMRRLMNYDWPGNVRELENCMERSVTLGAGPLIEVEDLSSNVLHGSGGSFERLPEISSLKEMERRAILQTLEAVQGDKLEAARRLGIGKTTMYRKLKEYETNEQASL